MHKPSGVLKGMHHRSRLLGGGKQKRLSASWSGFTLTEYESFLGMSAGKAKCELWECGRPVLDRYQVQVLDIWRVYDQKEQVALYFFFFLLLKLPWPNSGIGQSRTCLWGEMAQAAGSSSAQAHLGIVKFKRCSGNREQLVTTALSTVL